MWDIEADCRIVTFAIEILESCRADVISREWGAEEILLQSFDHTLEKLKGSDFEDHYELQCVMFELRDRQQQYWSKCSRRAPSTSYWRMGFACKSSARVLEELIGEYWLDC